MLGHVALCALLWLLALPPLATCQEGASPPCHQPSRQPLLYHVVSRADCLLAAAATGATHIIINEHLDLTGLPSDYDATVDLEAFDIFGDEQAVQSIRVRYNFNDTRPAWQQCCHMLSACILQA